MRIDRTSETIQARPISRHELRVWVSNKLFISYMDFLFALLIHFLFRSALFTHHFENIPNVPSLSRSLSCFLAVLAWIVKTNLSCKHTRVELLTMDINEIWNYAHLYLPCALVVFSKDFRRLQMDSLRLRCVCLVRVNELIPLRAALDFVIDYFSCFAEYSGLDSVVRLVSERGVRVNWISLQTAALRSGFNHQKLLHLFSLSILTL